MLLLIFGQENLLFCGIHKADTTQDTPVESIASSFPGDNGVISIDEITLSLRSFLLAPFLFPQQRGHTNCCGTAHSRKARKPSLDWVESRLVAEHYTILDRASNRVQLWRICAVFFCFLACFCPKPNGKLCCCSLPANDGLLMIDIPQ